MNPLIKILKGSLLGCLFLILSSSNTFGKPKKLPDNYIVISTTRDSALLDTISKGRTKVVCFWATWCSPCVKELNTFNALKDKWAKEYNTDIIAISIDHDYSLPLTKSFVTNRGWTFPVYYDFQGLLSAKLKIDNIPYRLLIDKQGSVVEEKIGFRNDVEELELKLDLLK